MWRMLYSNPDIRTMNEICIGDEKSDVMIQACNATAKDREEMISDRM
jgi:hypothetical protein